jgi:hypothetical protein
MGKVINLHLRIQSGVQDSMLLDPAFVGRRRPVLFYGV